MHLFSIYVLLVSIFTSTVYGDLYSNSLVNCMANNTDLQPDYFDVTFSPSDRSINYDISLTAKIEGKLKAYATVYAFGFEIIHETFDLCALNLKELCPITPSKMEVQSVSYVDQKYVDMIPGIAYTFPNIDAIARLIIVDDNNDLLGCLQATINNGKSVSHEGAKWATAVVAGIGLLISAYLSLFGNSAAASRMSAAAISLFTYFQSVVIISMIHVESIPPIAASWAENLAWSMGIIRIEFMQKIFRWYIQATGGTPTQYLTTSAKQILTQRSNGEPKISAPSKMKEFWEFFFPSYKSTSDLLTRETAEDLFIGIDDAQSNNYLNVLRGMDRVSYGANVEPTSLVTTGFTFFILFLYLLVGLYFVFRGFTKIMKNKSTSKVHIHINTDQAWTPVFKGMLARYIYIGFPQLTIFSLWEFTVDDSAGILTLSVFFFIMALSTMAYCCYYVFYYARKSIRDTGNPAAYLYGDEHVLSRFGFLYTMLDARKYWFCAVILVYTFIKALFVSLSQDSGKTQAMALWILDMIYLGVLIHFMPYLDRLTNVLSVFIGVIVTINSFFFTFFSDIYNQKSSVSPVMGIIFFIMNAAVSLILLIYILFLAVITVFFKNPDAKFSPTKDDRTSFQKGHPKGPDTANELFQLGMVAKDHNENWRNTLYGDDLKNSSIDNEDSDQLHRQLSGGSSRFGKVWGKLSRGLSQKKASAPLRETRDSYQDEFASGDGEYHDYEAPISEQGGSVAEESENDFFEQKPIHRPSMDFESVDHNNPFQATHSKRTSMGSVQDPFSTTHYRNDSEAGLSTHGEPINSNEYRL